MTNGGNDEADPLEWKLRVSARTRYAKLQIKPYGGLEVVIPPRFPRAEIPLLVERHAAWARRQLARQTSLREAIELPDRLDLAFDNSSTPVRYRGAPLSYNYDLFGAPAAEQILIDAGTQAGQIAELRAWIRQRARALLPPLLREVADRCGLDFARVSIRSQKTRWGSCSARAHISLNDQLLFLPAATVEYLMVHELCHTRHLNHSKSFWRLVQTHCRDYRQHEALLSQPRRLVPDWYLLGLYS